MPLKEQALFFERTCTEESQHKSVSINEESNKDIYSSSALTSIKGCFDSVRSLAMKQMTISGFASDENPLTSDRDRNAEM